MNEKEKNLKGSTDGDKTSVVKKQLEEILSKLQAGCIPEEETIQNLSLAFEEYRKECIKTGNEFQDTNSAVNMKRVSFEDILPDGNEKSIEEELVSDEQSLHLLKRLAMQKIILKRTNEDFDKAESYLIQAGIAAPISIDVDKAVLTGYCLTTKGWTQLRRDENAEYLKNQDETFLLAEKLCLPAQGKSEVSFIRAALIQMYYAAEGIGEYFIFADYENSEMLFGCKIQNSYTVDYCVAGAFGNDDDVQSQEALRIRELTQSDEIDTLTIIVESREMEEQLKKKYGLEPRVLKKLHYYDLEEAGGK